VYEPAYLILGGTGHFDHFCGNQGENAHQPLVGQVKIPANPRECQEHIEQPGSRRRALTQRNQGDTKTEVGQGPADGPNVCEQLRTDDTYRLIF